MEENKPIRRRRRGTSESTSEPIEIDCGMKITVHRGTEQIGGCVTEYEHCGWRLFVDYGEQLPGKAKPEPLQIEGLTHGDVSKSALLITHYHGDHIGCITELPRSLPIYMSEMGRNIQQFASAHLASVVEKHKLMVERLKQVNTFKPGTEFTFGPFTIMPIMVDHSAFDASAFKITADGVSVFHTGDFRTHGFRSKTLPMVIEKFIGHVHYVVCEGTNIARPDATSLSEHDLQSQFESTFRKHKNNIVYLSSTNIDRLFALYHAAGRIGRPFIVSSYQKRMMDIVVNRDPIWGKSRMYQYSEEYEPLELQYDQDGEFRVADKFQRLLDLKGCVMIAQANDRFDHLIERLTGETQKYLSMWEGYLKEGSEAYNPRLAQSLGKSYLYMHTSGHCDMKDINNLFEWLEPWAIIPIHTDKPDDFAQLFGDRWPILRLHDGETFSPVAQSDDSYEVEILLAGELEESKIICREENAPCYELQSEPIGYFMDRSNAEFALTHIIYRSDHVLGYEISKDLDFFPFVIQMYDADMNILSKYEWGGHKPKEARYQEPSGYKKGDKVLAVKYGEHWAIIPSIVLGPISPEYLRENFEQTDEDDRFHDDFEEYKDSWNEWTDWDWDIVAIHHLVKLKAICPMVDTEFAQRVHLFPYREFKFPKKEEK